MYIVVLFVAFFLLAALFSGVCNDVVDHRDCIPSFIPSVSQQYSTHRLSK